MRNPLRGRVLVAALSASFLALPGGVARAGAQQPPVSGPPLPYIITGAPDRVVHFVPNTFAFWDNPRYATTILPPDCNTQSCEPLPCSGPDCVPVPAYANVLLETTNFLECKGGPFALCYYSGPEPTAGGADLSCTLTPDGRFANCNCYEIPYGKYFVDINSILNYGVYVETTQVCGSDGSLCTTANQAPVCQVINQNRLIPGADLISAFSFDCVPTDSIGQTDCSLTPSLYAGCMTAPCWRTGTEGIVQCSCPTFDGPFEVGLNDQSCELEGDHVWSAAFSPTGLPVPQPPTCIPDAPGSAGCPLLPRDSSEWPSVSTANCDVVCAAYACATASGVESAYTCDASLCTDSCNDLGLVAQGCAGLGDCPAAGLQEIIKVESEAECSCCASQLCNCQANATTESAIFALNEAQRRRGIVPQCDVNGTLCGTPP